MVSDFGRMDLFSVFSIHFNCIVVHFNVFDVHKLCILDLLMFLCVAQAHTSRKMMYHNMKVMPLTIA